MPTALRWAFTQSVKLQRDFVLRSLHLYVIHHLQTEVVFGALQDQSAAHVGCGVVEVKDHVVGLWASFRSKNPVDLLGSLHLIGQLITSCCTMGTHMEARCYNIQ